MLCTLGVAVFFGGCVASTSESVGTVEEGVTMGSNLIANGDAEAGAGATSSGGKVTIPDWKVASGTPLAIKYGTSGFPSTTSPGPSNRGLNLFSGGDDASASLTQTISVSANANAIDAGQIRYDLSGYLGGWSTQNDNCTLKATFLSSASKSLGTATIGPVTAANRNNVTGLLLRDTKGSVPAGTRSIDVVLTFTRVTGTVNDGFADNLSLTLSSTAVGDAGAPDHSAPDATSCSTPIPSDPLASQRSACDFTTGATATSTLPLTEAQRAAIPIKTIIVMMKENRSFDHLLGQLHSLVPAVEAIPAGFTNPNASGSKIAPFHQSTTCIAHDPSHQWSNMHAQVDNGAMDGFVKNAASTTSTDGEFAMSYYQPGDIPFYYWLASTYPVNDRHFASARSGTFPDRNFLLLATPDGVQSTGSGYPLSTTPTIFDSLDAAHVTWGVYSDGPLLSGTLNWSAGHAGTGSMADFFSLLDAGTLPHVVFIDGQDSVTDDHPTADVQAGEAWSRNIYEHATASPLWANMAILWTYDEGGGFFDHVPPPNKWCVPRPSDPPVGGNGTPDSDFFELGVRVPMVVISPYARAGYTSHVVQEHTAITRFIETVFNLPALTNRDANSDALLDMFDFGCAPAFLTPPPAPASGSAGCP
jgi:phospholipase C